MGLGSIMAALSITASATSPASAQVGLGAVAAFCGPKQAFGIPFGSREAPGIHMSFVSSLIPLDAAYSPFSNAEVMVTLIGRRRHTIHAQADFASELRAQDALATVRATLLAQGWIEGERAEGKATTSLYSDHACAGRKASERTDRRAVHLGQQALLRLFRCGLETSGGSRNASASRTGDRCALMPRLIRFRSHCRNDLCSELATCRGETDMPHDFADLIADLDAAKANLARRVKKTRTLIGDRRTVDTPASDKSAFSWPDS